MQFLFTVLVLFAFSLPACLCPSKPIPKAEADAYTLKSLTKFCELHNCNASNFKVEEARERVAVGGSDEYLAWLYTYKGRDANGADYSVIIMLDYCGGTEISFQSSDINIKRFENQDEPNKLMDVRAKQRLSYHVSLFP